MSATATTEPTTGCSRRSPTRPSTSCARRIGKPIENTIEPWCHEATRDNIRHYAHGIGDDNPLWCDPDYAARSAQGGIVALPSFLFTTSRIISGYVGGIPGVHAMWAGADWRWHRWVRRNEAVTHRGLAEGSRRAQDRLRRAVDPAGLPCALSSAAAATCSPRRRAGASAPIATRRARRAPSTRS